MLASLPLRQVAREMAQEADEALCSVEVDSGGSNTLGSCAPTAVRSRKRTLADAPTPSEIFPPRPLPEHLRTDSSQLESAVFRQFHRKTSHRLDDPFDEDFYRHETELTTHNTCERLNSDIRPRTHSVQTVAVAAMAGAAVAAATVAVAGVACSVAAVLSTEAKTAMIAENLAAGKSAVGAAPAAGAQDGQGRGPGASHGGGQGIVRSPLADTQGAGSDSTSGVSESISADSVGEVTWPPSDGQGETPHIHIENVETLEPQEALALEAPREAPRKAPREALGSRHVDGSSLRIEAGEEHLAGPSRGRVERAHPAEGGCGVHVADGYKDIEASRHEHSRKDVYCSERVHSGRQGMTGRGALGGRVGGGEGDLAALAEAASDQRTPPAEWGLVVEQQPVLEPMEEKKPKVETPQLMLVEEPQVALASRKEGARQQVRQRVVEARARAGTKEPHRLEQAASDSNAPPPQTLVDQIRPPCNQTTPSRLKWASLRSNKPPPLSLRTVSSKPNQSKRPPILSDKALSDLFDSPANGIATPNNPPPSNTTGASDPMGASTCSLPTEERSGHRRERTHLLPAPRGLGNGSVLKADPTQTDTGADCPQTAITDATCKDSRLLLQSNFPLTDESLRGSSLSAMQPTQHQEHPHRSLQTAPRRHQHPPQPKDQTNPPCYEPPRPEGHCGPSPPANAEGVSNDAAAIAHATIPAMQSSKEPHSLPQPVHRRGGSLHMDCLLKVGEGFRNEGPPAHAQSPAHAQPLAHAQPPTQPQPPMLAQPPTHAHAVHLPSRLGHSQSHSQQEPLVPKPAPNLHAHRQRFQTRKFQTPMRRRTIRRTSSRNTPKIRCRSARSRNIRCRSIKSRHSQ